MHWRRWMSRVALCKRRAERRRIERCLEHLWFCDEIVVVDDCSTDGTYEYLRELSARFAQGPANGASKPACGSKGGCV